MDERVTMTNRSSADADRAQRFPAYDCSEGCPVEATLEIIGGKWKGLALYHLMGGPSASASSSACRAR